MTHDDEMDAVIAKPLSPNPPEPERKVKDESF